MTTMYRPKAKLLFPNTWAVQSFLLRLKRNQDWKFHAAANATSFKLQPGFNEDVYILIGLNKVGAGMEVAFNGEKLGEMDWVWERIYDIARRYRA